MSSVSQIHDEAMTKLELANEAMANSRVKAYKSMLIESLELEKEAAYSLLTDFDCEPTRSVLFRSAASIAIHAAQYQEAIILAKEGLKGQPFAEIKMELEALLDEANSQISEQLFVLNDEGGYISGEQIRGLSKDVVNGYLLTAVKAVANNDGWAHLSQVESYLMANTPFHYEHFGFPSLQKFIASRGIFDIQTLPTSHPKEETGGLFVKPKESFG
jgi:OST-HTH/LOTUS domain